MILEALLIATSAGLCACRLRPVPMGVVMSVLSIIEIITLLEPQSTLGFVAAFFMLLIVSQVSYFFGVFIFMRRPSLATFKTALHFQRH